MSTERLLSAVNTLSENKILDTSKVETFADTFSVSQR